MAGQAQQGKHQPPQQNRRAQLLGLQVPAPESAEENQTERPGPIRATRTPQKEKRNRTSQPGKSYDYVSGCPLQTPTGAMKGSYHMVGASGETFDIAIPEFPLIAPAIAE